MGWLFFDKLLRLGVGFFVGIWVMRYLQPELYGKWNYAMAFVGIFDAFVLLGLDSIVVHKLVKNPEQEKVLLGTSFILKLCGAFFSIAVILIIASLIHSDSALIFNLITISSLGFLFYSTSVLDFFFQAKTQSKYTVWANNIAFVISTILKITFVVTKASVL